LIVAVNCHRLACFASFATIARACSCCFFCSNRAPLTLHDPRLHLHRRITRPPHPSFLLEWPRPVDYFAQCVLFAPQTAAWAC
jgi:hypothetical protein